MSHCCQKESCHWHCVQSATFIKQINVKDCRDWTGLTWNIASPANLFFLVSAGKGLAGQPPYWFFLEVDSCDVAFVFVFGLVDLFLAQFLYMQCICNYFFFFFFFTYHDFCIPLVAFAFHWPIRATVENSKWGRMRMMMNY